MSMKRSLFIVVLFFLAISSIYSFLNNGRTYIAKDFFDSDEFVRTYEQFQIGLEQFVLNDVDEEAVKKNITVTDEEVERYRMYYGNLPDQIEKIKGQYVNRLADETKDADVKAALEKERDDKIADVQRNFSDSDYVKEKIKKEKLIALDNYMAQYNERKKQWEKEFGYFAYQFVDEDGNEYARGNVKADAAFTQTFGVNNTIFNSDAAQKQFNVREYTRAVGITDSATITLFEEEKAFNGTIAVPQAKMAVSPFGWQYDSFKIARLSQFIFWLIGIAAIVLLWTKFRPNVTMLEHFPRVRAQFERLPLDGRVGIAAVLIMLTMNMLGSVERIIRQLSYVDWRTFDFVQVMYWLQEVAIVAVIFGATLQVSYWVYDVLRDDDRRKKEWQQSLLLKFTQAFETFYMNRSVGMQNLALLVIVFLGGFGFAVVIAMPEALIVYVPLFFFIFMPALLMYMRRIGYLNRIMKHTEQLAEGRLTSEMKVKGKSAYARHAAHLNALRDGVRTSMNEQAKSERLKTELITNVSHDLRTPLTSIITYTDLLKNPQLSEAERVKYIAILDAKSARLKTLIEDLFEVSRMASGNMELYKQRVDLAQLLLQGAGEHVEDFTAANLDLRIDITEQPIHAYVDGQKWWRVIDNLIVNARKYSLPGTRVYVTLKVIGNEAQFIVKNVAKYELSEDAAELTERFKRADESRHTEGSGLGLAIAQSIVDMHNGRLKIDVDGDLFKVTVTVPAVI